MRRGRPNANYQECLYCSLKFARRVTLTQVFTQNGEQIIIEDIPTTMCDQCEQSYVDLETARKIDEVLADPQKYTQKKTFQVADFAEIVRYGNNDR